MKIILEIQVSKSFFFKKKSERKSPIKGLTWKTLADGQGGLQP